MMIQNNENDVTASGDSDTQMPAVGGQCSPQVSLSNPSTKSVGSPKQGHTANNGVGNVTAVGGAEQALDGGRKATEVTATGIVWIIKDVNNEVNELCIKFSELRLKNADEENDLERLVKKASDKNNLKRKSRSPERYERLKKKIKIEPHENHENIQKNHSIVKVPSNIKCDFHSDISNSTPAVTSKKKNVSNIRNLNNEVHELCIKFSKLKLQYENEEGDLERIVKMTTDKNILKRKSISPEKFERPKKKFKIKPDENDEKIQKIHSIVKDPPRKIKRIDVIDLTLSDDEEQGSNHIIDLTLSDDEEQGNRPSYKVNRNGVIDLTISDDEEPQRKKR